LPARIFAAYCYVPFGGLAIVMAALMEKVKPAIVASLFVLWLPLDVYQLNASRNQMLSDDREARQWILTAGQFARTGPPVDGFIYDGRPAAFHDWGLEGTLKYFYNILEVKLYPAGTPEAAELLRTGRAALLTWNIAQHRLDIQAPCCDHTSASLSSGGLGK
jgi:hypothetical protein